MQLNTLINKLWYVQEIIVIKDSDRVLNKYADINKIKDHAIYSGTVGNIKSTELKNFTQDVKSFGTIDNVMIIEIF